VSRNNRKLRCYKRDNRVRKFLAAMPTPDRVIEGRDSDKGSTSHYWFSKDHERHVCFIRHPKDKSDVLSLVDRSSAHVEASSLGRRFDVAAIASFVREFLAAEEVQNGGPQ
jgi:hypothetical protein